MAKQYYSVLTNYGTQVIAGAIASKQPLQITQMAVGDGNGQATTPNSRNTGLVREVHRADISAISVDPCNDKQIIFELTIPENVGGFWIREMGIFDNQNRLVAYANCPDSFKPELTSGSGKVQVVRMILLVSSSDAITLKVDDSVIFATRGQLTPKTITATSQNAVDESGHSHEIDKASTSQAGIVELDSSINSKAENKAATPKAVKTAYDKASTAHTAANNAESIANSAQSKANSAYTLAQAKQSPATTLAGYGIADFKVLANLGTQDLNLVTTVGIYGQASDSLATSARHYPEARAGALTVKPSAYGVMQEYVTQDKQIYYARNQRSGGGWSEWVRVGGDKANSVHTHTASQITDFDNAVSQQIRQSYQQNLTRNGWCKYPNGLIVQWGVIEPFDISNDTMQSGYYCTFPRAFTTQCFVVNIGSVSGIIDLGTTEGLNVVEISDTKFKWWSRFNSRPAAHGPIYWTAVGY